MQEELKNLAKALQESNLNHNVIFERAYKEESKKANYLTPSSFTACLCKMNSNLQHKGSRTALIVTEYQESIDNPLNPSTKIVMCNYKKLCNELDIIIQHKPRMNLFFQKLLELMRKGKNSLFSNLTNLDYNGSANTGKIDMEKFSQLFYNSTNTMITPEEAETLKSIYDSEGKKIIDHVALKNDFINYCNNANVKYDDLIAIKPYSQKEKAYLGRPVFVNFDYFMNKNQITDPRDFFRDYGMNEEACTVTRFSFYDAIHDFYPAISTQIYNMLEDEMQTDRKEAISVTRFIQRYEEIRKDIDRTSEYQFYGNSRTSYNPNKAFVFQYISRHFESKDGLREALKKKSAQYGYIEQNDNIKNKGFGDFLTDQKIDVAELDQRRLDDIFLHQDTQMYDLSELMAYNEQVHNPANNDIRDKGSKDILQLVKRMMNFTAHNKIKLFKAFIEADKDHDGLLVEEEFLKTTKFLLMPLDRKMNILELRYKEFGDSRVNYLSLLYDMYCLRSNWNSDGKDSDGGDNTLPEFLDFPHQKTPKRDDEIRKIMANFSFIMKKKEITSEAMVGEMVDMARSHSIRNSVILLKVIDIMEEELFKDSANMNMGASMLSNNSRTNKSDENYRHPLLSVFEIVDCLDIDNQGSILDYDIVHRLNNLLNSDLIDFSSKLLNAMETNNCHLEMLIDKTIVENRNVNLSKLKDVLQLKADIHPDLTQKMFKTISIAHLDEIPLDSLKTKLDREICILGQERPEVVKQYIYGPQASGHITADGIGVGDLIRQLHLNMERQKKTFKEVFFRDPTRRKMPKEEFKTIYQQFIVGQHSELEKLLKKITDNQNKTMIDLNILEAIYNSKYGKVVAEDPASLTVETTLKNLRQTVAIFGHSAITLFNSADSNASNSLDREEFFALLLRLDDTIKREETNLIFDKTDDDRSGSINFKEFEQLFNVNSKVLGQKLRVDAIKWAKDIFEEINTKLQDTGRTVEDAIKNKEKLAQVPISNLREMMKELNVTKYLEDESTANKFDNDLKATGRSDMIDFNAFKSFLYLFMPVSRREEAKEGVLTALLARYGNNAKKTVEGLNVKVDNDITRVEFCTVAKKICSQYSEAEINNTYSIIVGDVNKNDITVQDLIIFLENFIESKKQKATQDPNPTSNAAINKEFDQTREKIRRFFNYDSSRFSQDINLYANQRKIKMSVALDYLERATLKLTKEERDILSKKIDPNMNGIVDVDHITSLIFFGKANLSTLTVMHYSAQLQLFLQQVRNEINNTGKGSYEVFMRLDGKQDKVIDQNELSTAINTYGLVMDVNDQLEVFTAISQNRTFFTIEDFRKTLHGKKLEDLGQLVFEIQDKAKAEGKKSPEELFFPSKVEMPELDFNAFATNMLKVNKTWTYEVIDICFSKMDGDCTGKVGVDKFNNLISDYAILNDFKDYLVQYAQNHGKHLQEVFAIASFSDGMVKEDFKRFCKTITEGKFEETSVDKLFSKLDINNDGVISKMEMSHVYDLTERHLYSIREFTYFRNSIMDYCDQNSMSLQALYRKYAEGGILTIDQIMKLAEEVIKRNDFNPSNLRKAFDMDFNMKISLMEFKKALLNSSENVEELILSIRKELNKIGFSDNTNKAETDQALKKLDDVFEKYDLNRNGYLDFDEFKSFLKSTNLRLTFPQVQLIFDFINCNQDDKLSREEIFAVFYSKAQLSKHFLEIVQKFKLEVASY